jgi:hypothetical protein
LEIRQRLPADGALRGHGMRTINQLADR